MKLKANYSQALDQVPPGLYSATVHDIKEFISKKDAAYVRVTFKIVGGDFNNRWVFCNFFLAGKASGYFRKFIRTIKPDYIDGEVETADLLNQLVRINVAWSYSPEGVRSYNKVTVYPADYMPPPPNDTEPQAASAGGVQ